MKTTAIICEYNPFHNGHKYLIEKAREGGATHIMAVMGGNFLQRGECAVMDKFSRARAAVLCGVDLVIELPVVYAVSGAEGFASGAVEIIEKSGCVDEICFGTEGAGENELAAAASLTESPNVINRCTELLHLGYSHPRAMQTALLQLGDEYKLLAKLLEKPNNTLAVEYIKALNRLNSKIQPKAVSRIAVEHNSDETCGCYASASKIRQLMADGDSSFFDYIPKQACDIIKEKSKSGFCPASVRYGEKAILSALRRLTPEDLAQIPDVTEGLENRLYRAVRQGCSFEEIISQTKSKRYTYTRISRIIMRAYLGITRQTAGLSPQYIRVLGFNDKGAELLSKMKDSAVLPTVVSVKKDMQKLGENAKAMLQTDILATDLYGVFTPTPMECGLDYKNKVKI
ncbi:MAG: nucleotidyltransferase family protein [Lachnospiraceae bacterium]|nr:nucleotidyltransferase family protein [Lachnospiraceae bacterium]